jgi:hypothetical protein
MFNIAWGNIFIFIFFIAGARSYISFASFFIILLKETERRLIVYSGSIKKKRKAIDFG